MEISNEIKAKLKKSELKIIGFVNKHGFLQFDLKHDFTLIEGDKNGYLDVFELNHESLRFDNIDDIMDFIRLVNK